MEISSKNPFEVGFNLVKNEKVSLSVKKLSGDGQPQDLRVVLFQSGSVERVMTLAQLSSFTAPQDAAYKFKLDMGSSKKSLIINLAVLSNIKPPEEAPSAKDNSQISSILIGAKDKSNAPQPEIKLEAKKGQSLTPKTNLKDDRLDYIKYTYSGDGQTYYLADQTAHEVMNDGKVSFKFFLDQPKKSGIKLQEFLKKNNAGILLDNLQIQRSKPTKGAPKPDAGKEDALAATMERIMDEQNKALSQKNVEDSLRYDALLKKGIDTFALSIYTLDEPFYETIPPQANITESGNRPCFPIENLILSAPQFFAYYILLGEDAPERYEKAQIQFRTRAANNPNAKFVGSLLQSYSAQMVQGMRYNPNKGGFYPMSSTRNKEFVDYAIVDHSNMLRFKRGENYTPYYADLEGQGVSYDYGNAPIPVDPSNYQLYLCVCNRNFLSPVNVFFTYETFSVNVTQNN